MTSTRGSLVARLLEAAASMAVLWAMWQLFVNWADANVAFFGVTPTVEDYHVETYQQSALIGIAVAVAALVVNYARGRGKALYWHSCVGLALVVFLAIFHVEVDSATPTDTPDGSTSGPNPTVCHSGGDNTECVGG